MILRSFIGPVGMPNSICGHSSKRCRWTSCGARHPNWCARKSGRTYWPTISSARSSRKPHPNMTGNHAQLVSKERFKRWKRFNRSLSYEEVEILDSVSDSTITYSHASPTIESVIDQVGSNPEKRSEDSSSTTSYESQDTKQN